MLAVLPNRFRSAGRLRNLAHIGLVVDDGSDAFANELVIVNGHYSDNVVGIHLPVSKSCRLAPIWEHSSTVRSSSAPSSGLRRKCAAPCSMALRRTASS